MRRLVERYTWLKRLGPIVRVFDALDAVLGWWERIPRVAKHLTGYALSWLFYSFGWALVSDLANYGTRNWPVVLLVGFTLASITWAVIEAMRFRLMQRAIGAATGRSPEGEHEMAEESVELLRKGGYNEEQIAHIKATIDGWIDRNADLMLDEPQGSLEQPLYKERVALPGHDQEPGAFRAEHAVHEGTHRLRLFRLRGEFPARLGCVVTDPNGRNSQVDFQSDLGGISTTGANTALYPDDFTDPGPLVFGEYKVTWIDANYRWARSSAMGRVLATSKFTVEPGQSRSGMEGPSPE